MVDPTGPSGAPGEDASVSVASERSGALALAQIDLLRESILRRIMRAACAVGTLAMVAAAVLIKPINWPAETVGAVATLIVFGATLLPTRLLILSAVYPWALVTVGLALTW